VFASQTTEWLIMEFSERLAALRKERGLTQKALAEQVGVHITQIQRYENGSIQPTLDVLRRLAVALSVSADLLVFDKDERGPDADLKLEFEALSQFSPEEKAIAKKVLQGLIIQHQAKRWTTAASR
jgi:transcriptional regulator with XRE-family HTH domain